MNADLLKQLFEAYFNEKYEWEIVRGRRGYKLTLNDDGTYFWDIPRKDYEAWVAGFHRAVNYFNEGEKQ